MITETISKKKRRSTNGSRSHENETNGYRVMGDWPLDYEAAYRRGRGPYTVENAIALLGEEPLELFNGWLVWQAMTDARERRLAGNIQTILDLAARAAGWGLAYPDQFECVMLNGDMHKPDVCIISNERYERLVEAVKTDSEHFVLRGSPELVVEIRSPSNRRSKERAKRRKYFESGAAVIWDVDQKKRKIWVYEAANIEKGQEYTETDEISCEPLLPNWKRKVADLFRTDLSAEEVVGEIAGQWRAESHAEGELKGRAEGELKGRAEGELSALRQVLLLQIEARFGKDLPDDLTERLNRYDSGQLLKLVASLATANSLNDWLAALPD